MKLIFERYWVQELGILLFSFILFALNDWILIESWKGFFLGILYFMLLYAHAQTNRYALLPILFKSHRLVLYILLTLLLMGISSILIAHFAESVLYRDCFLNRHSSKVTVQYQFGVLLGSCICIMGTTQFLEHYRIQKSNASPELLSTKKQVDLLNKQLNPHFLFNTLNTIYGLSIKFPDKTPDAIMKVSELLRYQVENCNKEMVCLEDEVGFIESYIELERERMGYRCSIVFNYNADSTGKRYIAPMIIFTFVENAFKHGTRSRENSYVNIDLSIADDLLCLQVSNSVSSRNTTGTSTKLGLENTMARLHMIYPKRHTLAINELTDRYEVNLEIKL